MASRRDDAAEKQIESTLAAHPDFMLVRGVAALFDIDHRCYPQAEAQLRALADILLVDRQAMAVLARGVADPAQRAAALRSLQTSPATIFLRNDVMFHSAFLTTLGEHELAIDQLEQFAAGNYNSFAGMLWTPSFDPIRGDPRFKAVLAKTGLPYMPKDASAP